MQLDRTIPMTLICIRVTAPDLLFDYDCWLENYNRCATELYADDTEKHSAGKNCTQITRNLNDSVHKFENCVNDNKLLINPQRTEAILFATTRKRFSIEEFLPKINGSLTIIKNTVKFYI